MDCKGPGPIRTCHRIVLAVSVTEAGDPSAEWKGCSAVSSLPPACPCAPGDQGADAQPGSPLQRL